MDPAAAQSQAPPFGGSGPAQSLLLPRWPWAYQCCQVWEFPPQIRDIHANDGKFSARIWGILYLALHFQ